MFGLLPPDQEQRPHRHQSVALDLILDAKPGCYTLLGTRLDERGDIVNPTRVDWEAGGAFVTPPGLWHAHFNESGVAGASDPDPGRGPANLPAQPGHPVLRPPVITRFRTGC